MRSVTSAPSRLPFAARGLPDATLELLRRQGGLATRSQLLASGVSASRLRWRLGRDWSLPLPGVVLVGDGELTSRQRERAACLYAGPEACLGGPTAAARHGIEAAVSRVCHVVVPARCAARQVRWLRIHRSTLPDPGAGRSGGIPLVSPRRAVIDAARWARDDAGAVAVVIEACQRRIVTPEALARELARFGTAPGTARARRALAAAEEGAWSVPEATLAGLVARSRELPAPWLNPVLGTSSGASLVTPDLWFDDVGLAVMVHSKAHHLVGDDWSRTVEQDGELVAHGIHVLGLTPATIGRHPGEALRRVERAHAAAQRAGRPDGIVARPRHAVA